ncbi:hypothetical protein LZ30DRAFT_589862 [Colletotrichum cereale]|nr:hypothetical protein LZ30DRAFT_589862 [Colletotrichum cereale]
MRTPRIAIIILFFAASLFLFCRSVVSLARSNPVVDPAAVSHSRFQSLFSFTAPFSIFTPNAAISLTDDNSTSFVARPAAFGPNLPNKGLSGQLWIGSGFADDNLQEGEGEGELGCTDIPGWEDGKANAVLKSASKAVSKSDAKAATAAGKPAHHKRDKVGADKDAVPGIVGLPTTRLKSKIRPLDDGTDDYLHQGLARKHQPNHYDSAVSTESTHADIQSIQEAAEIAGKIVLLSRGGCGFLEKAKWAQRRGAIALIVGDNTKGGPLIQMFARGDTSNVSIPSVFTTRTTAHLLSSLTQPGSFIEDTIDEHGRPALKVLHSNAANRKNRKNKQKAAVPMSTPASKAKSTTPPKTKAKAAAKAKATQTKETSRTHGGFFSRLFSWGRSSRSGDGSIQPPSSGRHNWVLVDDWSEEKDRTIRDSLGKAAKRGKDKAPEPRKSEDSFQIGVQDWRDPDLVDAPTSKDRVENAEQAGKPGSNAKGGKDASGPKGGSITPGSGEYNPNMPLVEAKGSASSGKDSSAHGGIMSKIFGDDDGADFSKADKPKEPPAPQKQAPDDGDDNEPIGHDGLWVTITPSTSSSPFFDTLLVLVVSPLITLSVVYALLILRARIRRRRWRAPKSVVERLPVRTYHTVAASPLPSPRLPSPTTPTPTTPLLQQSPTRPRPRSRTTTGIPESESLLSVNTALQMPRSPRRAAEHEKPNGSYSSEWKKYMGRQVECVVCLEEYVDGVSRVMSLPCGHEFHVECITPWLTTRRRTCPICKGDVVRSLARGSPSSPRYEPYRDDSDDEVEAEASGSRDRAEDMEQGILSPAPRGRQNRPDGWLGLLSGSFGTSNSRTRRSSQEDRNR